MCWLEGLAVLQILMEFGQPLVIGSNELEGSCELAQGPSVVRFGNGFAFLDPGLSAIAPANQVAGLVEQGDGENQSDQGNDLYVGHVVCSGGFGWWWQPLGYWSCSAASLCCLECSSSAR